MTKRTKYVFADRAEAESAWSAAERRETLWRIAVSEYFGQHTVGIRRGPYKAILCGPERCDGGAVMIVYTADDDSRNPSVTVYDPDGIRAFRRDMWNPSDDEGRQLRDLLDCVLAEQDKAQRAVYSATA